MAASTTAGPALTVVNALLLTMVDGQDPFHGWLTAGADGRIIALGPGQPPHPAAANQAAGNPVGTVFDAGGRIVAPGFVSAHSHLHTSGMRGIAADEPLYSWVRACVTLTMGAEPDDMYWFVLHGALDFLASGITAAFNFPQIELLSLYHPDTGNTAVRKPEEYLTRQFDAVGDSGLRVMGAIRLDEEAAGGPSDAEVHARFARLLAEQARRVPDGRHLGTAVYGGVQWAAGPRTARLEAEIMTRYGLLNQAHFLETAEDLAGQQRKFAWYAEAGVLGPEMIFGHFVHPTDEIVDAVAASGSRMVWQPTSNGRLGSGVADVVRYRRRGIAVGVGLDDQSCTDTSDPFANMRLGMYSQRTRYHDPGVLTARDMLRLHTLGSAEVLGLADRVGSLAPGRYADFLVVDPAQPDTGPVWDPYATYVQACGLRNLQAVYVGGRLVSAGGVSPSPLADTARRELHARVIASAERAGMRPPASSLLIPTAPEAAHD